MLERTRQQIFPGHLEKFALRVLGINGAFFLTNNHDGAHCLSGAAPLADWSFIAYRRWHRSALALARGADLSRGYVDVWEEGVDSGSDALGQAAISLPFDISHWECV